MNMRYDRDDAEFTVTIGCECAGNPASQEIEPACDHRTSRFTFSRDLEETIEELLEVVTGHAARAWFAAWIQGTRYAQDEDVANDGTPLTVQRLLTVLEEAADGFRMTTRRTDETVDGVPIYRLEVELTLEDDRDDN